VTYPPGVGCSGDLIGRQRMIDDSQGPMINVVGAVRQIKYCWLAKAHGRRATDYDIAQHRLATCNSVTANVNS